MFGGIRIIYLFLQKLMIIKMNKIYLQLLMLFAILVFSTSNLKSENTAESEAKDFDFRGVSLGTGINSPIGMLGADVEFLLQGRYGLTAGIGVGSWGSKTTFTYKQYLGAGLRSINIGYSLAFGINEITTEMHEDFLIDRNEAQDVTFKYLTASTLNISYIRHFHVGSARSRILLELGYAIQLNQNRYRILTEDIELSDQGKNMMSLLQPGGVILAFRFNFG
jgi:hypothetical protein